MTQFPNTSTSLPFEQRSNVGEVNSSRRDNQSGAGSSEDSRFSRALDDSDARTDVQRDDTQTTNRESLPRGNSNPNDRAEQASPENNTEPESEIFSGVYANGDATTELNDFAFLDVPEVFNPFTLTQQLTTETPQQNPTATLLDAPTTPLTGQAEQADQNLAPQINNALPQTNNFADNVLGEISETLLTTQLGNINTQQNAQSQVTLQQNFTATSLQSTQLGDVTQQIVAPNVVPNAGLNLTSAEGESLSFIVNSNQSTTTPSQQPAPLLSGLSGSINTDLALPNQSQTANGQLQQAGQQQPVQQVTQFPPQSANATPNATPNTNLNANLNFASSEGEQLSSIVNSNQSTTTPSQQLASLLSGGSNADITLPNQGQVANGQLQQAVQQQPIQQATQPVAQFANTTFANNTLPTFTAQISRNFAAGQDSFNVRLNPSELGRVDVRIINNDDGTVSTQIRVERSETLDLFQRDIRALERTLQQSGVKLGSDGIDLSLKDNDTDQGGNNQAFDNDFDGQGEHAQNSDPALEADNANHQLDNDGLLVDDLTGDIPLDQIQTIYARYQPGQLNIRV